MAGPEPRSSMGSDWRLSTRSSLPPQPQFLHVDDDDDDDDDDYDLQAMGISDGFRPQGGIAMTTHSRMPSGASQYAGPRRSRTPPPRPSSTTKPRAMDTFDLRYDGGMGTDLRRSSTAASNFNPTPARSPSGATDVPHVRPESPYQGPSGPSHPYQMYPQESRLARTASMATTSTAAVFVPERPYNGPGGPTHPYGMYPQNTVPEAESVVDAVVPAPVGFPGLNNDYQRRLGSEGEEMADIIGPDGHTEQLPPYTKYPDEAIARQNRPAVAIPVAGAGGLGLATRNPEFSSTEDLESPSRDSTRSALSEQSNHQVNTAAAVMSEKPELNKWQKRARRKIYGVVPVWVLLLIGIVFILFGIILGTVLAVLKPPKRQKPPVGGELSGIETEPVVVTTLTTTYDASPLTAVPTGLAALPTGTYTLPISAPAVAHNECISDIEHNAAWSCQIPISPYTVMVSPVTDTVNDLANVEITLKLGNQTFEEYFSYGTQPPVLSHDRVLTLVSDPEDPAKGPAWFFEMTYDKIVILPENAISGNKGKSRRRRSVDEKSHGKRDGVGGTKHKIVTQPGDSPWFCYWNGTLLEAYIYANLTSSAGQPAVSSSSALAAAPTAATSSHVSLPASYNSVYRQYNIPLPYPKVLKIRERRIPGPQSIPPYCVQHEIDQYGDARVALDDKMNPIVVDLNEIESSIVSAIAPRHERDVEVSVKRQASGKVCDCVWLWT